MATCWPALLPRLPKSAVAAQTLLADVPLARFLEEPLVPYEIDEVTRLILDSHDRRLSSRSADLTVGQFRDWLLSYESTATCWPRSRRG